MEKRSIVLPNGSRLDIEFTPEFCDRVRNHFGLPNDIVPDDTYIRMFVWGAMQNALSKVESDDGNT